jgi:hypothetical protein
VTKLVLKVPPRRKADLAYEPGPAVAHWLVVARLPFESIRTRAAGGILCQPLREGRSAHTAFWGSVRLFDSVDFESVDLASRSVVPKTRRPIRPARGRASSPLHAGKAPLELKRERPYP